jgi:hypothetical protein
MRKKSSISLSVVWLIAVGWAMIKITDYKMTPGQKAVPSLLWPRESKVQRNTHQATLVLFIHPHCPCTRATVSELARLMTTLQGKLSTCVLFIQPDPFSEEWVKTDLWTEVRRIPGVQTFVDHNGQEAEHFGSYTSGQVFVYAPDGRLMFNGGITPSRGHEGDNLGVRRIISLVRTGHADQAQSAVFGCALQERETLHEHN